MLSVLCLLTLTSSDEPKLDGPLHMAREKSIKVEVMLTEALANFDTAPEKWWVLAPMLPTYEAQAVHKASFYIPTETALRTAYPKEKGGLGQSYMSVQFNHPASRPVTAQAIYEVTLYKRKLTEGSSPEKPFPLGNLKLHYTANHPWLDLGEPTFKEWLREEKLVKTTGESDLKYAWRAFKEIATFFRYDVEAEGLTPLSVIAAKKSNTLGLATLYLAILRSQEIPSRYVVSMPLRPFKGQENFVSDTRLHEETADVIVEFWTEDQGWVPTDIVRAAGFHEPSRYFGKSEGNFVAYHFDMIQFERGQYSFLDRMDWNRNLDLGHAVVKRKVEFRKLD